MTGHPSSARRVIVRTLFALVLPLALLGCVSDSSHQHPRHGNIKEYLSHLDRAERDESQKPDAVVAALGLTPGMTVADLGSGSGYFTRRFVEAVTESGKVYAVDVEPEMLDYVKRSIERMDRPNHTEYVLAKPDDPHLPAQSVDLIFVCNTFHHLEHRDTYFSKLKSALKPGGRIAVIDFYHDERSGELNFPRRHLVPRDTVLAEMTKAGYALSKEHSFLPRQYFLEFTPDPPGG